MGLFGDILGGVASLFGGNKTQKVESTVNYSKMVKKATEAGFNPLTALRNGGSAGFTTTTSPSVSQLPDVLGNLGGVLGDALDKKLDPIEAKKRELDTALVDAQLRSLRQGPQLPGALRPALNRYGTQVSTQLVPRVGPSSNKVASVPGAYGPKLPPGAGKDGEILPAVVAWRRSDNSLMYTYNPQFPDGDAQVAGAAADAGGRFWDEAPYNPLTAPPTSRKPKPPETKFSRWARGPQPAPAILFRRPSAGGGGW